MEKQYQEEHERMKNNVLADITNQQQNVIGKQKTIAKLKEQHAKELHRLKQNFREKLEKISEMKKKWMEEEENKRIELQVRIELVLLRMFSFY